MYQRALRSPNMLDINASKTTVYYTMFKNREMELILQLQIVLQYLHKVIPVLIGAVLRCHTFQSLDISSRFWELIGQSVQEPGKLTFDFINWNLLCDLVFNGLDGIREGIDGAVILRLLVLCSFIVVHTSLIHFFQNVLVLGVVVC